MLFDRKSKLHSVCLILATCILMMGLLSPTVSLGQSLGLGTGTSAQDNAGGTAVVVPENLTPETVRDLVSKMSDQQVRQLLLERLDAVAKEKTGAPSKSISQLFSGWAIGIYTSASEAVVRLPRVMSGLGTAFGNFFGERGFWGSLWFLFVLLLGIGAGIAAYFGVLNSRLKDKIKRPEKNTPLKDSLKILAIRLGVDLLALFCFFLVSYITHRILLSESDMQTSGLFTTRLIVLPMILTALTRFLMSPKVPELRLVHTDDETARFQHKHIVGIALMMGFGSFITQFSHLNGVPMGETRIGYWFALGTMIYLGYVTYQSRHGLTQMLIGRYDDATPAERRFAHWFPWIYIVATVIVWCIVEILVSMKMFDLLQSGPHYVTLILLAMAPAIDTMIRGLVYHLVPPMSGEGVIAERAYESTKRSYIRIGRVLMVGIVTLLVAGQWQIDFTNLASSGLGAQFAARMIEVLIILAVGYVIWELATLWLNRKLAAEQTAAGIDLEHEDEPGGGEGGGAGASRLTTVLPLLRLAIQTLIVSMTVLVALGNMGIDVTPLLAGAGIVGIAVGFGAQTLVRDVVSGIFFLVDDAFRLGEYVVIDQTVGTVEKISLRSMQLRHHLGAVHTVPYGEIPKITNNSRDWVIMKLKFTFPFDTNANQIKKIFKKIGQDILEADYADDLIQTFKSQGVYAVDDIGIVMRGKFMTKPGAQWIIRKDIYNRIQAALDEAGIQFARKEVRVQLPGIQDANSLSEDQKQLVAAAASDAAEKADQPPPKK